jgi:phage terminase large subunit-like protein
MLALEIRKQMNIKNIFFVLDEIRPQWEKEARIRSILQPRYSNYSIKHHNSFIDLELELLKFPNGKHDDRIDALAWAVNMLNTFNITSKPMIYSPDYI